MKYTHQKMRLNQSLRGLAMRVAATRFGLVYARVVVTAFLLSLAQFSVAADELMTQSSSEDTASSTSWKFRVWLDDKEIGYHNFFLAENGNVRQLHSEASFEYKLLFVKLYGYEHENRETWNGDCLQSIESVTDANGQSYAVSGALRSGNFELDSGNGEERLPNCVMSFAYWNPEFLKQGRLLNTQNGEYLEIEVSAPVFEELEVQGERRPSWRYHLAAGPLNIDLWYSPDEQWLALESEAQGGRKIRYELL